MQARTVYEYSILTSRTKSGKPRYQIIYKIGNSFEWELSSYGNFSDYMKCLGKIKELQN